MRDEIQLEDRIEAIRILAKANDLEAAMRAALQLAEEYPDNFRVWSLRGYLHLRAGDARSAVADLSAAIAQCVSEPALFFDRGRCRLGLREWAAAEADFSKGLDLCDHYKDDYYRDVLHFLRAEALVQQGKKTAALRDLELLPDDFRFWTYRLVSKVELTAECS
jgi:tetratricopeptide (TPR) repeat protein